MRSRLFFVVFLSSWSFVAEPSAEDRAGFVFLNEPPSAAPEGMAGAAAAWTGEPWTAFYNPAGLARLDRRVASGHGRMAWEDVFHEAASYARPTARGAWSATAGVLGVRDLLRTRYDPSSSDRFSAAGSVQAGAQYAAAAYGGRYSRDVDWGAGVKFLRENLGARPVWTAAADAGAVARLDDKWSWGAVLRNAGPDARSGSERRRTPLQFQAGLHFAPNERMRWEADLVHSFFGGDDVRLGGEYGWEEKAFLRFGYRHRFDKEKKDDADRLKGASAGLGGRWGDLQADYAFQPFGDLGDIHRVSLSWNWGSPRREPFPSFGRRRRPLKD